MTEPIETNVRLISSPRSWLNDEAIRQLYVLAKLDGVRKVVGLPNLSAGKTYPSGIVVACEDMIYPQLLGEDIGCGLSLFKTDRLLKDAQLDRWVELRFDLEHPWEGCVGGWLQDNQLPSNEFDADMGTLGGGHHFAELQAVERVHDPVAFKSIGLERQGLYLLVHSGSRGYGEAVARDFKLKHGDTGLEAFSDAGLAFQEAYAWLWTWATANRELIALRFLNMLGAEAIRVWDEHHNRLTNISTPPKRHWLVHARGASSSFGADFVVIPGSCGSLSYLVKRQGDDAQHLWSLPNGAGSKWPRSESRLRMRQRFGYQQLVQSMESRVICEERNRLYEQAPESYRDLKDTILDLVEAGCVSVVATFRPLLTYKTRTLRR